MKRSNVQQLSLQSFVYSRKTSLCKELPHEATKGGSLRQLDIEVEGGRKGGRQLDIEVKVEEREVQQSAVGQGCVLIWVGSVYAMQGLCDHFVSNQTPCLVS
jgi:hypothetical protein